MRSVIDGSKSAGGIAVAGLVKLLEPVMIFILGVIIGGIVIAMYLPIFDLISKLT